MVSSVDSVKDSEDIKNNEKSMLMLNDAAQSAAKLTELWPLTEARHLDNDAKSVSYTHLTLPTNREV